jgi:hypothetical protein
MVWLRHCRRRPATAESARLLVVDATVVALAVARDVRRTKDASRGRVLTAALVGLLMPAWPGTPQAALTAGETERGA